MTAINLPITTAPGEHPQESGGRLFNCFAEALAETSGAKFKLVRGPGLSAFGTTAQSGPRGMQLVGANLYGAWENKVVRFTNNGAANVLSGTLSGTVPVSWARNNAAVPDLVAVSPGDGAFVVSTSAVSSYPDPDVGQPNSACFLKGFFFFSYGDGKMRASGVNSTAINTLDVATAESKPDTLYRVMPLGNGQLLAAGSTSMEVWGGTVNDTGFPLSYIQTIPRGILNANAIAGYEDGFGAGVGIIADNFGVYLLNGYAPEKISPPDLDRLIERDANQANIQLSVYVSQGHSCFVVQSDTWTWVYDTGTKTWHERQSYLKTRWRAAFGHNAFGKWFAQDIQSGNVVAIDGRAQTELGQPLRVRIETGPMGNFPSRVRVKSLDLFMTVGIGVATGVDPIETDPTIEISISNDNGVKWSQPWLRKLGRQSIGNKTITVNNMGHVGPQGVKLRFDVSDPVHVSFMGGDLQVAVLGK